MDSPELRSAIKEVQPEKVAFELRLEQSKPIYNAFKAIQESPDWPSLSDACKRIVESQLKEATLNGVSLEDDKREKFNKVQQWAEVLSADAFSAFEDAGLDDSKTVEETGHKFRETILALGGGKHPMEVFVKFRGRGPSPEPLLRHNGLLPVPASA